MNKALQNGHVLSTTMIVLILFSLLSLTALRNGLIDFKIAQAFDQKQLNEERHLSALRFTESKLLVDLINPSTELFRDFSEAGSDEELELAIPMRLNLGITESDDFIDPTVRFSQINNSPQDLSTPLDSIRLLVEVQDRNTGHQLIAVFRYRIVDEFGTGDISSIQRLSLRRNTL